MGHKLLVIAAVLVLNIGTAAQAQFHPPTSEGAGAKPGAAPQQGAGGGAAEQSPDANRRENAQSKGGADSQLNRDYGKDTTPTGKELHEGQPAPPKP